MRTGVFFSGGSFLSLQAGQMPRSDLHLSYNLFFILSDNDTVKKTKKQNKTRKK